MLKIIRTFIFGRKSSTSFGKKKGKILGFLDKTKNDLLKVISEEEAYISGLVTKMDAMNLEIETSTKSVTASKKTVDKLENFLN